MKGQIGIILATTACMATLVGCSPDEPSIKNDSKQEYADNWEKIIGDIDPDQSWNIAKQHALNVNTGDAATVSIYTKSEQGSYLVANTTVNGAATIKFDLPSSVNEVYVVKNENSASREVAIVNLATTQSVSFNGVQSLLETRSNVALAEREKVYAVDYNFFPSMYTNQFGADYFSLINYNHYHEYYRSWGSDIYAIQGWNKNNSNLAVGEEYQLQGSKYQDVAETCANMYVADDDNITKLYPYTQNYKISTTEAGEISLIGIYRNTNAAAALIYFYTDANASVDEMKKADKYVLIPNNEYAVNRKFTLVYYDPANDYAPTTTFPAGKEIHFGLVRGYNAEGAGCADKWVDYIDGADVISPAMYASLCMFSNAELNKEVFEAKGWTNMSGSALYSTHGVNILSFEDWGGNFSVIDGVPTPAGQNSVDWNDVAFIIDGNIEQLPSIDEAQSWILACEDLGNIDDFDFNDVVISITHVAGSETATITPLAAGGELASTIYFKNNKIGEIHDLLIPGSSAGIMLNTTSKGNPGAPVSITVGADFSMASTDMGGFTIVVDGNDGQATIAAPEAGSAPQMICIDGNNWLWPTERTSINVAYTQFATWAADHTQANDWYRTPASSDYVVK